MGVSDEKQAQAASRAALEAAGFRKRAGSVYTLELSADVLGFVGLNRAANRPAGPEEINPVIGVRHQAVEQLVAELTGQKPDGYRPPTLSSPLGYLMPEARYTAWFFGDGQPAESTAAAMVEAIQAYGVPFMQDHATLASIIDGLVTPGLGIAAQTAFRLPVAYQLAGQTDRAQAALAEEVDQLGDRSDAASTYYRDFAAAFEQRFRPTGEAG